MITECLENFSARREAGRRRRFGENILSERKTRGRKNRGKDIGRNDPRELYKAFYKRVHVKEGEIWKKNGSFAEF